MIHFFHKKNTILVSTNLKVMYSSLKHTDSLVEIKYKKFLFLKIINIFKVKHYLLVRNPYTRIVSFYKNKFQGASKRAFNREFFQFEYSQKLFFTHLNINSNDSNDVIASKLCSLSFVDFIRLLPQYYQRDFHMHPQSRIFYYKIKPRWFRWFLVPLQRYIIKFKIQIIKIEDLEKMNALAKKIDLDMSVKKNNTQSIKTPALTPETIKIIKKIYYDDFILFGYKTRRL